MWMRYCCEKIHANGKPDLRGVDIVGGNAGDIIITVVGCCVKYKGADTWPNFDTSLTRLKRPLQAWLDFRCKSNGDFTSRGSPVAHAPS